jgi:hypothetical protein
MLIVLIVGLIPREDCASDHVLRVLEPYSTVNGGPLEIQVENLLLAHSPHLESILCRRKRQCHHQVSWQD